MAKMTQNPLNQGAEGIRKDQTGSNAPRSLTQGQPNRGSIYEPSGGWANLLPPEEPRDPRITDGAGIIEAQHRNFNRPFVGSLDAIDRGASDWAGAGHGYPETPILESSFVGVDDNPSSTPLRNAPMTSRSSLKPSRIPHGARSTKDR